MSKCTEIYKKSTVFALQTTPCKMVHCQKSWILHFPLANYTAGQIIRLILKMILAKKFVKKLLKQGSVKSLSELNIDKEEKNWWFEKMAILATDCSYNLINHK